MLNENTDINICIKCDVEIDGKRDFRMSACNHSFCRECLCKYLKDFNISKKVCPAKGCSQLIPDNIILKCLSNMEIEDYKRLCHTSNAVKCLIENCDYYYEVGNKGKVSNCHFLCQNCEQPNCLSCSNLHWENEKCGVSQQKIFFEENASFNLREKRRIDLLNISRNQNLLPNPEISNCEICYEFLLPREGIMLSSCCHNFCRNCLDKHVQEAKVLPDMTCLSCKTPMLSKECSELLGEENFKKLNLNALENQFYHCKTPDCTSMWDMETFHGLYKCEQCHKVNCIPCDDIHEGLTCAAYKQTPRYKERQSQKKLMESLKSISCFNCKNMIVKKGGCGALRCNLCYEPVCAFTGKCLGPNGCQCQQNKRCHVNCNIGCIPEGKTNKEVELKKYYYSSSDDSSSSDSYCLLI